MLVLGRRTDESLLIGDEIVVTILGIEGDRVKIGISAPRQVTVLRSEVRDRQRARTLELPEIGAAPATARAGAA